MSHLLMHMFRKLKVLPVLHPQYIGSPQLKTIFEPGITIVTNISQVIKWFNLILQHFFRRFLNKDCSC